MKIKALLLFFGIIISQLAVYAQNKEFKFGKIPPQEFQLKASGPDSAASALKIFDVGNLYFEWKTNGGFVYVYERHVRYKILNKNSYDLANLKLPLYRASGDAKEDLTSIDAATYNMVDDKMVTSKLNRDAKFTEDFNKYYTIKKFALPNVKEGSIIEFKYTIKSDFIRELRGWSFQTDVPTLHTEYNVKIPQYFIYKANTKGYYVVNRTKHETVNASYDGLQATATYDQYALDNVPALKEEAYVTTMDDYRPSIDFELQATNYPGDIYRDRNGTWPKIVKDLAEYENFGLFINKNSYAKSVLPTLLKSEKDTLAITKLIVNYVKNNIKWNKDYDYSSIANNPKAVFDKKSGNSADINLSLMSLLKEAKINFYPVLVSTRENGVHPGLPTITKFNNVLAAVNIANKTVILDATNKDLPVGMIGFENLNHQGLAIDLKNTTSTWIAIEPEAPAEKVFNYFLTLTPENKLTGKLSQYSKGYSAFNLRDRYRSKNNEAEFLKDFIKDKTGLQIANYKIDNLDNLDELLIESMDVDIEDNVDEAGNLVYFTPLLFERTKENLFKHEERLFPVDFGYPIKENYRITINFPENYEIDKLPTSTSFKIPDGKGTFTITFITEGKTIQVKSLIEINRTIYEADDYFNLKELFKNVVQKQAEQIVFKKKAE